MGYRAYVGLKDLEVWRLGDLESGKRESITDIISS